MWDECDDFTSFDIETFYNFLKNFLKINNK